MDINLDIAKKASNLVKKINSNNPDEPVFCVGLDDRFFIGVGAESQLILYKSEIKNWHRIDEYFDLNKNQWIAGYIGYEILRCNNIIYRERNIPVVHLICPDTVYEVTYSSIVCTLPGRLKQLDLSAIDINLSIPKPTVSLVEFLPDFYKKYSICAVRALDWVVKEQKQIRRMTVSYRVELKNTFDLIQSIIPFEKEPISSIPCYWQTSYIEFGGISPERTLYKKSGTNVFQCQKISGTFPRNKDLLKDESLRKEFINDEKNNNEHDISVTNLIKDIDKIGFVSNRFKEVIDMPYIRHLSTYFDVNLKGDKRFIDLCKEIYPKGVYPLEDGLKKIFQFESKSRGPYYGMFLLKTPTDIILGAHILRMLFRDVTTNTYYTHAGACITNGSNVVDEYNEIQLKLNSIVAHTKCN